MIVTDRNIYKYEPKQYKVRKDGVPLQAVTGISASTKQDTYVVVHCTPPERDMVVDLGRDSVEKVSEFVAVVYQQVQKLTNSPPSINFKDNIKKSLFVFLLKISLILDRYCI